MRFTSLDVLLYAHDGRGTGHVSRSAAIGMALRRLYPQLRVILVTGSSRVAELIGPAPLDSCKLPSYATRVVDGISCGVPGPSGFEDKELGSIRERMLADLVRELQPRIVLADHSPQGKHRELLPALRACSPNTQWFLGIRAIVGRVDKVFSPFSADIFKAHYTGLFWYGDSSVLGREEMDSLQAHYGVAPQEAGYVCRTKELEAFACSQPGAGSGEAEKKDALAGVAALSWNDANSPRILEYIVRAASRTSGAGQWRIYMEQDGAAMHPSFRECMESQDGEPVCELRPFGREFHRDMCRARMAVIYGGYNSLTDVMARNLPTLVLLRGMRDKEQERHMELLSGKLSFLRAVDAATATTESFLQVMEDVSQSQGGALNAGGGVDLDGAANTAHILARTLGIQAGGGE